VILREFRESAKLGGDLRSLKSSVAPFIPFVFSCILTMTIK